MGLTIEGQYYKSARDAGPYVPPSLPSDKYRENYDSIRWDEPKQERKDDTTKT